MARTNTAASRKAIYTHEGAVAVYIDPVQQLRRSVMANMLWEDTFYEDGVSIADRITNTVKEVLAQKDGAQKVADIAVEARSQMKLRHVPLLLTVALIRAQTEATRKVVADTIMRVVQRADELNELVSMYWAGKKQPLTAQMKKGLAAAFTKFDGYQLAKYDSDGAAIKLRDVLFMVHGKPKDAKGLTKEDRRLLKTGDADGLVRLGEGERLYWDLSNKSLATPDTWEVELSAGKDKKETFTRLLNEENLGAMALLRNLRNMQQVGVDEALIRDGLNKMKTERVLPFRFITAAKYAPKLEPELEQKMFQCLEGHQKLAGKTVLVVDNSGSMTSGTVSKKSELRPVDAACALAMLLREICDNCQVVVFSDDAKVIAPRRGFALRDAIIKEPSGGTRTENALNVAKKEGYDRCIVITDEQSHQTISGPGADKLGYFINVANYQNGIGYKAWTHIDGWSEAVVDFITQYERFQADTAS